MGESNLMGKLIDLRDFALRSCDDHCEISNDQLLYWDGEELIELQDGLPIVEAGAQVIAFGTRS